MTISIKSPTSTTGSIQKNGTDVLTIDTNDNVNIENNISVAGNYLSGQPSFRNLIINGDMKIAQRGTSNTGQTTGGYTVDRFRTSFSGRDQAVWTDSQTTDVPSGQGFSNSFKVEMTTAETSMDTGTTEYFTVEHRMEGQHLQHLKYGTSSAEKLTMSFWVKSSVTGTLAFSIYNVDSTRIIGSTYTINTANTWEKKTITFDGDTVGTLDNDNAQSFGLRWFLGAADGLTSTSNTTWQSYVTTNFAYGHGTNAIPETSGATWQITGVQLEVGENATPFEHRPYDVELARCQRYFCSSFNQGVTPANGVSDSILSTFSTYDNTTGWSAWIPFPVTMRTAPTTTAYKDGQGSTNGQWATYDSGYTSLTSTNLSTGGTTFGFYCNGSRSGAFTAHDSYLVRGNFTADAEL